MSAFERTLKQHLVSYRIDYLVFLEAPKYKLLTYSTAKKIQNETAPNTPQSKITVSNFHNRGAMFVFKQRKWISDIETNSQKSKLEFRIRSDLFSMVEHSNSRFESIRLDSLCESIRFVKNRFFDSLVVVQLFLLIRASTKNNYGMHTIKITPNLLYKRQISQIAESNRIGKKSIR